MNLQKTKWWIWGSLGCLGGLSILFTTLQYFPRFYLLGSGKKKKEKKDPEMEYSDKEKQLFRKIFESEDNFEKWNDNISRTFYVKETYKNEMERKNNSLEKIWKSRIIMEHTPRGNVIMYYDAYKHGFAYYSDTVIPNDLLNVCAMKYVRVFFCRDFFIDKTYYPMNIISPFARIHLLEAKKRSEKDNKFDVSKGPFAKLKKPVVVGKEMGKVAVSYKEKKEEKKKEPEIIKNKFIHLGKTYNFSILQSPTKKTEKKDLGKINYSDFKSWQNIQGNGGVNQFLDVGSGI
jgi:hypothetical protein